MLRRMTSEMATILAPPQSSAIDDAAAIKKACLGLGTDEKAIISVLGRRNGTQIKEIWRAYKEIYQEDLIMQLKSELSGDFEKAICLWVLDAVDRDAVIVNEALRKRHPDYNVIVEMTCTKTPDEVLAIKRAYQLRYKRALEEDVASYTTAKIGKFLVTLASVYKYHGDEIDDTTADKEAKVLNEEIQNGKSNHEEIIRIIGSRSKQQLLATFNRFKEIHGTSISKGLKGEQENEFFAVLGVAIRCIKNPQRYYAKALRYAIRRPGTDEDVLTRVIVAHAEIDLNEIKKLYHKRTGESLEDAVAGDTSGDYKDFLLTLLGVFK